MSGCIVKALIPCAGCIEDELLCFQEGDLIEVEKMAEIGWWKGRVTRTNEVGYFDQTMVEIVTKVASEDPLEDAPVSNDGALPQLSEPELNIIPPTQIEALHLILLAIEAELDLLRDACQTPVSSSRSRSLPSSFSSATKQGKRNAKDQPRGRAATLSNFSEILPTIEEERVLERKKTLNERKKSITEVLTRSGKAPFWVGPGNKKKAPLRGSFLCEAQVIPEEELADGKGKKKEKKGSSRVVRWLGRRPAMKNVFWFFWA